MMGDNHQVAGLEANTMDILPWFRRAVYHGAGIAFVLSIYFLLTEINAAGAILASTGFALVATIRAFGRGPSTTGGDSDPDDDLGDEPW